MAAYVIADIREITDPDGFAAYGKLVPPTLERYGGRYLARGGRNETLDGDWIPGRLVIMEFETYDQAKRWHGSEEYREATAMRMRTSTGSLVLVEGV